MSQTNSPSILFVGLDVAKSSLQLHLAAQSHALSNDAKGHQKLIGLLKSHPSAQVVCEATGGYEQPVLAALHEAAIPLSLVEAGRVRHFAKAKGKRAKSDPIDAAVLSAYGAALQPAPTPQASPTQQQLTQLTRRRRQVVEQLVVERNHAEHYADSFSQKQSRQIIALLEKQIAQCEREIASLMDKDADLKKKAQRLQTIPGVGSVTAVCVLAEMPELGTLEDGSCAALAGLAPYNSDSGQQSDQRHIGGGRAGIRRALYMAALSAVRCDRILKEFYLRLRNNGKKPKVALTAAMRKLILLMNRLLKNPNFQLAS